MTLHHSWVATDKHTGVAIYTRYLECNACHMTLPIWDIIPSERLAEAGVALRYEAQCDGWSQAQDHDYCPECTRENHG